MDPEIKLQAADALRDAASAYIDSMDIDDAIVLGEATAAYDAARAKEVSDIEARL